MRHLEWQAAVFPVICFQNFVSLVQGLNTQFSLLAFFRFIDKAIRMPFLDPSAPCLMRILPATASFDAKNMVTILKIHHARSACPNQAKER